MKYTIAYYEEVSCHIMSFFVMLICHYHSLYCHHSIWLSDPVVFVTSLFAEYGGDIKTTNEAKSKVRVVQKHTAATARGAQRGSGGGGGSPLSSPMQTHTRKSHNSISPGSYRSTNTEVDMNNTDNMTNVEERLGVLRQECRRQLKALTYEQVVWYRREEENIPTYTKAYGVLQKGSLYFYKDKDEYDCYEKYAKEEDTKPIKLIRFELETNKKVVDQYQIEYSSVGTAARQLFFGTSVLGLKVSLVCM